MDKRDKVKGLITNAVLEYLNEGAVADKIYAESQLTTAQKSEIKRLVEQTQKRPGFMAFTYGNDMESDSSYLGVRVDPQNTKNWVRSKEEVLFKASYNLSEAIQDYTKGLLNEQAKS